MMATSGSKRGGWGRFGLVLVALALAGGAAPCQEPDAGEVADDPVVAETDEAKAAQDLYDKARTKEQDGDLYGAYGIYLTIAENYPTTHHATLASERVEAIESRLMEEYESPGLGILGAFTNLIGSCCWLLFLGSMLGLWGCRAGWFWRWTFLERFNNRLVGMMSGFKDRKQLAKELELRKANPLDAKSRHGLGVIYYRRRNYELALEELTESVRIDPVRTDAQYHLAITQMKLGKTAEAVPHLEYVVSKKPNHGGDAAVRLAEALLQTGDAHRAAELCADFAKRNPSDPESRLYLAMAYDALGHPEEVPRLLEEAVQLGRSYKGTRRPEALAAARRAKVYMKGRGQ